MTYNHLKQLGLERLSGVSPLDAKLISEKRLDYIKRWGKQTSTWTGKSLLENVKLVDSAYPPTCNEHRFYEYLYCQAYREGSQSAHSSFAGLSKGIDTEFLALPGAITAKRFKGNEGHLIFCSFHSILVFLSSIRFLGYATGKEDVTEKYFQKIADYIISEP